MARVLVVDDDEFMRRLVARMLEAGGHQVRLATGGLEALQMIASDTPDLVITDLMMSGGRGMEVITSCRRDHPGLPVVAVSGREHYLGTARTLGATRTLSKPFNKAELLAVVYDLLES